MNQQLPIICLMGPTATGKTDLAIELVQRFPLEIISVDSAMVYRDMNIGTAKPTLEALLKAPHRLINLRDPAEPYSVGNFRVDVQAAIEEIRQQGKVPLLVGGTMLYFYILQNSMASLPEADQTIREALVIEAERIGWPAMHKKLEVVDPVTASQLHPNDSQRIQRALEIYEITGQSMTSLQNLHSSKPFPYKFINIILEPQDRKHLHDRIAERFANMLAQGFLEEVKQLRKRNDLNVQLPSIRTVGYRQAWAYFDGQYDKEMLKERAVIATRQLAKRQLTWLRRWQEASRFYFENKNLYQQTIQYLKGRL